MSLASRPLPPPTLAAAPQLSSLQRLPSLQFTPQQGSGLFHQGSGLPPQDWSGLEQQASRQVNTGGSVGLIAGHDTVFHGQALDGAVHKLSELRTVGGRHRVFLGDTPQQWDVLLAAELADKDDGLAS